MNQDEVAEDIAFLLYLLPMLASAGYALVLWVPRGLSASLPEDIYLIVTKEPLVFLLGFSAICVALLIEMYILKTGSAQEKLASSSHKMQRLSIACVLLAALSAWSASGYSGNVGRTAALFLSGRYSLIFPLLTLITSFVLTAPRVRDVQRKAVVDALSVGALIVSPVLLYFTWRVGLPWTMSFGVSLLVLGAGLATIVYGNVRMKGD